MGLTEEQDLELRMAIPQGMRCADTAIASESVAAAAFRSGIDSLLYVLMRRGLGDHSCEGLIADLGEYGLLPGQSKADAEHLRQRIESMLRDFRDSIHTAQCIRYSNDVQIEVAPSFDDNYVAVRRNDVDKAVIQCAEDGLRVDVVRKVTATAAGVMPAAGNDLWKTLLKPIDDERHQILVMQLAGRKWEPIGRLSNKQEVQVFLEASAIPRSHLRMQVKQAQAV